MTSEPPVVGEPQQPEREQKSLVRRFGPAVVGIAAILLVFLVLLPRIANYSDVWDVVTGLSNEALVALAVATAINVATYGPPWMAALPGLNYRQSMVLTQTSSAFRSPCRAATRSAWPRHTRCCAAGGTGQTRSPWPWS